MIEPDVATVLGLSSADGSCDVRFEVPGERKVNLWISGASAMLTGELDGLFYGSCPSGWRSSTNSSDLAVSFMANGVRSSLPGWSFLDGS